MNEHKEYFAQSGFNRYHLSALLLLVTAFFIGWKMERKKWSGRVTQQITEVGTLAFLNYFKKIRLFPI
ncbi:MAG: hypothetical protein ACRCXC_06240 [Legionella sp.]